jgi:hypothetical protein
MRKTEMLVLLLVAGVAQMPAQPVPVDLETGLLPDWEVEQVLSGNLIPVRSYYHQPDIDQGGERDAHWDEDVRLTNNSIADYTYAYGRQMVATDPSGRIHVVWMSYQSPGSYSPQIYYKRYYPGSGWTNDTCISADLAGSGNCYYPAICVDSAGDVHTVWFHYKASSAPRGYYIAYKKCTPTSSGNGGWDLTTTRITEDTLLWYKFFPSIAATPNGRIHVVYYCFHSTLGYAIGYKEKIGTTWQPRVWVDSGGTDYYRWWPKVAADRNNNIHITWYGAGGGSYYQIGYRGRFSNIWGPVQPNISNGAYHQAYPAIAANPVTNHIHIVWQGYSANDRKYRIIHKERLGTNPTDTFQLLGDTVSEPNYQYHQFHPCITFTKNGRGHCVWHGNISSSTRYYQIRYNERSITGIWGTPVTLTSITTADHCYPSIGNGGNSTEENDLHLIWHDSRDGNWEVYYKHGGPPAIYDLAMYRIDVPASLHLVGENVNPSVWVQNVGTATVSSFSVKLDIGIMYSSIVNVNRTLTPGETLNVTGFAVWTPNVSGTFEVRCQVILEGDSNPGNNLLTKNTTVADFIEHFDTTNGNFYRTGNWAWGSPQSPRGTPPSSPNCWGDVLSGNYANNANDTLVTFALAALRDTPVVMFMHWMRCESYYDGGNVKFTTDNGRTWQLVYPDTSGGLRPYGPMAQGQEGYTGNWTWEPARFKIPVNAHQAFKVHWWFKSDEEDVSYGWLIDDVVGVGCHSLIDAGVTDILAPTGSIPYGQAITPKAVVANFGNGTQTFRVRFDIGTVYSDTQTVTLNPGQSQTVLFSAWTPLVKGRQVTRAVTMLSGDDIPDNDMLEGSVDVYLIDVQPTAILKPAGYVDSGAVIEPKVRVKNNGTAPASFNVRLQIGLSYDQQKLVLALNPDEERLVTGFPEWQAERMGTYGVRCSTRLSDDMVPANDLLTGTAQVVIIDVGATEIVEPVSVVLEGSAVTPTTRVKNFGTVPATFGLHFLIRDENGNLVYDQTESVTLGTGEEASHAFSTRWEATTTGGYQAVSFTVLGDETRHQNDTAVKSFIVRPLKQPGWYEMAGIPAEVKDGGWLVMNPDNGLIYAARGYKSDNFYCYDPITDNWTTLTAWPAGEEGKMPYRGSAACYGEGYIWAVKGNNTPGFWRYSILNNRWEQLPSIPTGTSGKNPKGGTDVVYVQKEGFGYVYLLKGYKQDFMRYNIFTGRWEPLTDAPAGEKPKWDKGSWLVYDGDHTIYAHKAKYHELWAYDIDNEQWRDSTLSPMPIESPRTGRKKEIQRRQRCRSLQLLHLCA